MMRLKANKSSLYKLVKDHDESVTGIRSCEFHKSFRSPSYSLDWSSDGLWCHAFFSTCLGKPMLAIKKKDVDGTEVSWRTFDLSISDLRERNMIEEKS